MVWSTGEEVFRFPLTGGDFFQHYSFQTSFGPHTASRRVDMGFWNMKVNLPPLPNADANCTSNHL